MIKFLKIWSSIHLPWGHARSHKKFGPDRFSRFDVYWIQTNKQTDTQAKFIWILWKIKVDLQVVFKMSCSGVGLGVVPGERSFFFSGKSRNVTNVLKKVRIRFVPGETIFLSREQCIFRYIYFIPWFNRRCLVQLIFA